MAARPADPERARLFRRVVFQVLLVVSFIGSCGAGLYLLREHVEKRLVFGEEPPKVVLLNRPAWMSDYLAEQLAGSARPGGTYSALDPQVLVDVHDVLAASPWVREVRQVRRAYGDRPGDTIEVDCDYHTPIALVRRNGKFHLIDAGGVLLPEVYTADLVPKIVHGRDGRTNIRIIEGVWSDPPRPGQQWSGQDLQAGIDMVRLLHGRHYTEEILKVDVSNFEGRLQPREAQLVLMTRHGTEIRWGRPVQARDFFVEVPTSQKLEYLRLVYEQHGRVDGGWPWIDIRFDRITHPSDARTAQAK